MVVVVDDGVVKRRRVGVAFVVFDVVLGDVGVVGCCCMSLSLPLLLLA